MAGTRASATRKRTNPATVWSSGGRKRERPSLHQARAHPALDPVSAYNDQGFCQTQEPFSDQFTAREKGQNLPPVQQSPAQGSAAPDPPDVPHQDPQQRLRQKLGERQTGVGLKEEVPIRGLNEPTASHALDLRRQTGPMLRDQNMLDHGVAVHDVERSIGEGQRPIGGDEGRLKTMLSRPLQNRLIDVGHPHILPEGNHRGEIVALPTSQIEDSILRRGPKMTVKQPCAFAAKVLLQPGQE